VSGSPELRQQLSGASYDVASQLLGCTLTHADEEGTVSVQLTEVEAYSGEEDPASHAFRGRTPRNEVMFGVAGRLYVYRSYGLHWCCNIVTGDDGVASAVLLRAGRVVEGMELAQRRRGERVPVHGLARGPGCLTQALGLTHEQNGVDLLESHVLRLVPGGRLDPSGIAAGHRVGVRLAHDVPWRFWVEGDPTVSAYKRSPRATS
jgi:DNA-3-methyladenine glycosylase